MDRKRVLLIPNYGFPIPAVHGGSIETMITDLLNNNELKRRLYFTVISKNDEDAAKEAGTFHESEILYLKDSLCKKSFWNNSKIAKWINILGYRIFNRRLINTPYASTILKALNNREFDEVIVMGGDPFVYEKIKRHYGKQKMSFNVAGVSDGNKYLEKTYQHFLCCSDYTKRMMQANGVIDKNRVLELRNCIDTQLFSQKLPVEQAKALRNKYAPNNEKLILFIGRTSPEKGVRELLEAFALMKNQKECKVLIAGNSNFGYGGKTSYEAALEDLVHNQQMNVEFTGFIHHNELWKLMSVCDFAVLPSMWEEPAGNVVPECMATGLPVVITDSGGMIEYVDETCAIVVKRDDELIKNMASAMDSLACNVNRCKQMGIAAREKAKEYDVSAYYDKLCDYIGEWSNEKD